MSDPTPKPTACRGEQLPRWMAERDTNIRRKAFEEAAEIHPGSPPHNRATAFKNGWYQGIKAYSAVIRALAKEHGDG